MVLSIATKRDQVLSMMGKHARHYDDRIVEDARLCDGVEFLPPRDPACLRHVVVTGATGFLGVHVLKELLERSDLAITCVVRADSDAAAQERVLGALKAIKNTSDTNRVRSIAHDLSDDPLKAPALVAAADDADAVIHCAARVNFTDRYPQSRAANVLAMKHLLSLFSSGQHIHHVSTVAVFAGAEFAGQAIDEDTVPRPGAFASARGYCQSKLAGELMLDRCRQRGLPATVYRPGIIGWDTRTGSLNQSDFLTQFIAGSVRIGALPDIDIGISIAPVDYVAEAIVASVLNAPVAQDVLHLVGDKPMSIGALARYMAQSGVDLQVIPYPEWLRRVDADEASPLRAVSLLLPPDFPSDPRLRTPSLLDSFATDTRGGLTDRRSVRALEVLGVKKPHNDDLAVPLFVEALTQ